MQEQDPFYISKRNRRGVISLFIFSLIVVFTPRFLMLFEREDKIIVSSEEIESLEKSRSLSQYNYGNKKSYSRQDKFKTPERKFDPNDYTSGDWIKLGLSEKQVAVIMKFTSRGVFSNEDLKKIFVIPEGLFNKIKDSTYYPQKETLSKIERELNQDRPTAVLIDLNKSSVEDFTKINGIGPFYAKQIIRYREQLGGYHSKEQLLEVWKMNLETYEKLKDYIFIQKGVINKISLNSTNINELNNHPYLNWNQANSIIKMKEQRGGFKSISDIKESILIDEETFEKLVPYLTL
ncbi:MAG: helix-hairpin-helix domain-containing protein [Bacteroidota bacterium]